MLSTQVIAFFEQELTMSKRHIWKKKKKKKKGESCHIATTIKQKSHGMN